MRTVSLEERSDGDPVFIDMIVYLVKELHGPEGESDQWWNFWGEQPMLNTQRVILPVRAALEVAEHAFLLETG